MDQEPRLFSLVRAALASGRPLDVPSVPHIAAELLQLTSSDDPSFREIAACIARDSITAAKLVGMANSASFRGRREFQTIEEAVIRLGTAIVRAFAMGVAASSLAPLPGNYGEFRQSLWNQCVATGIGARMIGDRMDYDHTDTLFLSGLFSDIGNLVTLHVALKLDPECSRADLLDAFKAFRVDAGLRMLAHWKVPGSYQRFLEHQRDRSRDRETLAVRYASDASRVLGFGLPETERIDLWEHPLRRALDISREAVDELQDALPGRVYELVPFMTH